MGLTRNSNDDYLSLNHQPFNNSLRLNKLFNDKTYDASLSLMSYSSGIPQNDTLTDLPERRQPCNNVPYTRSFSIPTTYSNEMIHVEFGEPSKTGQVKKKRASMRPSPYPNLSQSQRYRAASQECDTEASSPGHLNTRLFVHRGNQRNACSYCDCSFSQKKVLNIHIRNVHGIIRVPIITEDLMIVKCFQQLQLSID